MTVEFVTFTCGIRKIPVEGHEVSETTTALPAKAIKKTKQNINYHILEAITKVGVTLKELKDV